MKTQLTNLFTSISKTEMVNLTTEVKETLAIGFDHNNKINKTFSAAELWSIQRQHRTMNQRRRFVY